MGLHKTYLGRLTMAAAATPTSNVLSARELAMMKGIVFYNPPAFTGVVSVKVGPRDDTLVADMVPLRVAGAAVTLTAASAQFVETSGFESLAVSSAGTEGAIRNIDVWAVLDLSSGS